MNPIEKSHHQFTPAGRNWQPPPHEFDLRPMVRPMVHPTFFYFPVSPSTAEIKYGATLTSYSKDWIVKVGGKSLDKPIIYRNPY